MKKEDKVLFQKEDKNIDNIKTDPLGSWTGVADDPTELPVQDVDDL